MGPLDALLIQHTLRACVAVRTARKFSLGTLSHQANATHERVTRNIELMTIRSEDGRHSPNARQQQPGGDGDTLGFAHLTQEDEEAVQIELSALVALLRDPKMIDGTPSFVNARPAAMNLKLIETCAWLWSRTFMSQACIHAAIIALETRLKALSAEKLPLDLEVINATIMSTNRIIPKSMFLYWSQKCWNFLECAK